MAQRNFKKQKSGSFFENEDVRIEIKYDTDSTEKELIKFIPKGKEVIISAQDILSIVQEQFRQKDLALALSTVDTSFVAAAEVAVPISYIANKDIKQGERVQFFAPMQMPLGVAITMDALKLCMDKGLDIIKIPRAEFDEASKDLVEKAKDFTEKFFKPQIEELKKLREESGIKLD